MHRHHCSRFFGQKLRSPCEFIEWLCECCINDGFPSNQIESSLFYSVLPIYLIEREREECPYGINIFEVSTTNWFNGYDFSWCVFFHSPSFTDQCLEFEMSFGMVQLYRIYPPRLSLQYIVCHSHVCVNLIYLNGCCNVCGVYEPAPGPYWQYWMRRNFKNTNCSSVFGISKVCNGEAIPNKKSERFSYSIDLEWLVFENHCQHQLIHIDKLIMMTWRIINLPNVSYN